MCLICVEFQKLSIEEAKRNLGEMAASLGDHVAVVEEKIKKRQCAEQMKGLLKRWEKSGLLLPGPMVAVPMLPAQGAEFLREIDNDKAGNK